MNPTDELIVISLKAHLDYMVPRMYDSTRAFNFRKEMFHWIDLIEKNGVCFDTRNMDSFSCMNISKGSKIALDIVQQICNNVEERYIEGRKSDKWLQKL